MHKLKGEILFHLAESVTFIKNLEGLSEDKWRAQIAENKWTVAEVVGHLIPWDEFLLNNRIPYLFSNDSLPAGPNEHEVNSKAALESRNSSKEDIIEKFIMVRLKLQEAITDLNDELWNNEIEIGSTKISLFDYLQGFAQHDEHHFHQIKKVI